MRIALVHPRLDHRGGAENVVLWMARGLRDRGHEVLVATRRFSTERWSEGDWDEIPLLRLGKRRFEGLQPRVTRKRGPGRRLRQVLGSCELIVAHNSPAHMWATVAARRMSGARVVWFCEEPSARFYWRQTIPTFAAAIGQLERHPWLAETAAAWSESVRRDEGRGRFATDRRLDVEAVSRVDLVLGNSAFTASNAERVYGTRASPCVLGLPTPEPVPMGSAASSASYVAWVTSGVSHKNVFGFLEAVRIAVHDLGARDLRVRTVGLRGEAFERRIASLGIESAVQCEGWIDDATLNELIARARLLAYPPIDEPFGLVPLHAMAHARPVLASGLGGPSETVVHGETGLHVDPLDPHEMATQLCALWNDPARCDALGAAGRERYLAHFTFEHFLDRFEQAVFGSGEAHGSREPGLPIPVTSASLAS